jgi:hypothetical protein
MTRRPDNDQELAVTDEELCAVALAADPDTLVADDAVSVWQVVGAGPQPLPSWYMPAPMTGSLHGWRRRVARVNVAVIIASFLTINAYGLCNTYGQLHF